MSVDIPFDTEWLIFDGRFGKDDDLRKTMLAHNLRGITIQYFKGEIIDTSPLQLAPLLEGIRICHSQIQSIDLWVLSRHTRLKFLSIAQNPNLSSIDITPLLECMKLEEVYFDSHLDLICEKDVIKEQLPIGLQEYFNQIQKC